MRTVRLTVIPLGASLSVLLGAALARAQPAPAFEPLDPRAFADVTGDDLPGGGVALGDVDGDGRDDVLAVRSRRGIELRFADASGQLVARGAAPSPAAFAGDWPALCAAPVDLDGDGRVELLLGGDGGAYLLAARADGGWDDRTAFAFDGLFRQVHGFAVADVDGDGLLDVHVVTYLVGADWPHNHCDVDALFLQREDGWVRAALPDAASPGCGFGAVWFDQDGDGDADAWVANDFGMFAAPSQLWRNDGVDATGALVLRDAGDAVTRAVATYAMGVAVGDLDGDGVLDVASSSIGRAPFHRGLAGGRFDDQAEAFGAGGALGRTGTRVTWGVLLGDLDGDGATDLLETGGFLELDPLLGAQQGGAPTLFYRGGARPLREDAAAFAGVTDGGEYRGLAQGDVDGDGAPDLALAGGQGTPPLVLRNASGARVPWLAVTPRGVVSPREARGARVTLACSDGSRRASVVPTGGNAASMSAPRAFVSRAGCDAARSSIVVDWPSGVRSTHPMPATGSTIVLDEPAWLAVDRTTLRVGGDASDARATVTVRPVDAAGPLGAGHAVTLRAIAGAVDVGAVADDGAGAYRATATALAPGEAWLAIAVDGRVMPRRVRLHAVASDAGWSARAAPAAIAPSRGVEIALVPRARDGAAVGPGARVAVALDGATGDALAQDRGAGRYVVRASLAPGRTAPVTLTATVDGADGFAFDVPVVADVDPARTAVDLRPGYVLGADVATAPFQVHTTLFTPLGDPIATRYDGTISLLDATGATIGMLSNGLPAQQLFFLDGRGDYALPVRVALDGAAVTAPLAPVAVGAPGELAAVISAANSRLDAMQTTLHADGVEWTALVLRLADAQGNTVPPPPLDWDVAGGTLDLSPGYGLDGSLIVRVTAGTSPGALTATARVRGTAAAFAATLALADAQGEAASSVELCAIGVRAPDGSVTLDTTVHPRRGDGVLAAGARDLAVQSEDGSATLAWDYGTYASSWRPDAARATTTVHAIDRGTRVPASPAPAIDAVLTLATGALAQGDGGWTGSLDVRDRVGAGAPSDAGRDAAADAAAHDAGPRAGHAGGGACGCRAAGGAGARARGALLAAIALCAGRRRRAR